MVSERKPDRVQEVYATVEAALRHAGLHKSTGMLSIRIDLNQGGITNVKAEITEPIKPNH